VWSGRCSLQASPDGLFVYLDQPVTAAATASPRSRPADLGFRHDGRIYGLTKPPGAHRADLAQCHYRPTSNVDGRTATGDLSPRLARLVEGLAQARETRLFRDRFLTPTLVDNLVDALLEILSGAATYRGVLHLAGSQVVTHVEHARYVAEACGFDPALIHPESMDDSPTMRGSPRHIGLDVTFTQTLLKTRLLDVPTQMARLFHHS
jgi:dTDP-4-dehydrorhamnose reductase